jgi:hypothetical protein
MVMKNEPTDVMQVLGAFLEDVRTKKAEESAAQEGHVEDQGDSGTSHPSKSIDNQTQTAPEGFRSSENSTDVKKSVTGVPTDDHEESKEEGGSENPLTDAKPTGETPSIETAGAKDRPDASHDTGHLGNKTTHPANVSFGDKNSSARDFANDFSKAANDLLAKVAMLTDSPESKPEPKTNAAEKPAEAKVEEVKKEASDNTDEAAGEAAAKAAAEQLGLVSNDDHLKLAAEMVNIVKDAHEHATLLQEVYSGMLESTKSAMDPGAMETAPPMGVEAGGAEPGMEAGPEPGMEAGPEGAGGGEEEIMQLLQALQEMGISPEDLANLPPEVLQQLLSGEGGGEPGMEGGGEAPPMESAPTEGEPMGAAV